MGRTEKLNSKISKNSKIQKFQKVKEPTRRKT